MTYDPHEHHRRSIRLEGHDYARHSAYFITICAHQKANLFGEIHDETAILSPWGLIVRQCWLAVPAHFAHVELDEFVVMPNHFHGIIWTTQDDGPTLGTILGSCKSAVTRFVNASTGLKGGLIWQRNYFEPIIRDDVGLASIREYILTNPQRWHRDNENPIGDRTDNLANWLTTLEKPRRGEAMPRPATSASIGPTNVKRVPQSNLGRGMPRPYLNPRTQ